MMVIVGIDAHMDGELLTIAALDELARDLSIVFAGLVVGVEISILKSRPATDPDGDLNASDSVNDSHCRVSLVQGSEYRIGVDVGVEVRVNEGESQLMSKFDVTKMSNSRT